MKRYHFLNGTWTENPKGIWVHYDDVEKARQQLKERLKSVGCLNSCCGSGIFPIAYRGTCKVIDEMLK